MLAWSDDDADEYKVGGSAFKVGETGECSNVSGNNGKESRRVR